MKKMTCPMCGAEARRRIETGYISGRELGRPPGAKGSDTFEVFWSCPIHGDVIPISVEIEEKPIPVDEYGNLLDGEQWE